MKKFLSIFAVFVLAILVFGLISNRTSAVKPVFGEGSRDELETAKRRFQLEKEIALTPAEIKKAAKKIGLTETAVSNKTTEQLPTQKSNDAVKPKQPTEAKTEEVKKELNKTEKVEKKPQKTETKKDAPQTTSIKDSNFTRKRRVNDKGF